MNLQLLSKDLFVLKRFNFRKCQKTVKIFHNYSRKFMDKTHNLGPEETLSPTLCPGALAGLWLPPAEVKLTRTARVRKLILV